MIRNPDDKELDRSIFNFFWSGDVDNTRWKKVQSDPMLSFLRGNQTSVFVVCFFQNLLGVMYKIVEGNTPALPAKFHPEFRKIFTR